MSILVVDQQVVHYEVFGHGRPVLFLHGWLGSWRYWFPTIERVAEHFRTYSFDFWGFGDTNRHASAAESIQSYSDQVIRFMDELGIDRVLLEELEQEMQNLRGISEEIETLQWRLRRSLHERESNLSILRTRTSNSA